MTELERKELTELCERAEAFFEQIADNKPTDASQLMAALLVARRISHVSNELFGIRSELNDLKRVLEAIERNTR